MAAIIVEPTVLELTNSLQGPTLSGNANTNSLTEDLVAYYKLDGDATDSSGKGNDGVESPSRNLLRQYKFNNNLIDDGYDSSDATETGTTAYDTGKINQAVDFETTDGLQGFYSNSVLTIPEVTVIEGMSVSFWHKVKAFSSGHIAPEDYKNGHSAVCVLNSQTFDSNIDIKNDRIEMQDQWGKKELVDSDSTDDWYSPDLNFTLNTTTKMEGTGAVNVIKTVEKTSTFMDASFSATNMSNSDSRTWLQVYIKDQATLDKISEFVVYLTNNGSSWNKYIYINEVLSIGWNTLVKKVEDWDSEEGGGADETAINQIRFRPVTNLATDMYAEGDLIVDSLSWGNTGITYRAYTTNEIDTWYYWTIVFNSGGTHFYKNGEFLATYSRLWINEIVLDRIGRGYSGLYTDGYIDDFRVYDRELNTDEVERIYNSGDGTEEKNYFTGKINDGMSLISDSNGAVNLPVDLGSNWTSEKDFSWFLWVKEDDDFIHSWNSLISFVRTSGYHSVRIDTNGSSNGRWKMRFDSSEDYNREFQGTSIDDNVWHHIGFTYTASTKTFQLYSEGVAGNSYVANGTFDLTNSTTYSMGGSWRGVMDDIRLYSKTLSQTEIDLIYATTNLTLNSSLESPTASGGANIVSSLLELNLDMNTVIVTGEGNIYPSVLELDLLTLSPYVNMAILSDPMLLNVDDALKNPNIKKILKILSTPDSIKSNNVLKLPQIEDNAKSVGRPDSIKSSSVLKKPKLM